MQIRQFVDEGLGNSTHLVISEAAEVAALIDPLRDVDRYLRVAEQLGVRITQVFETHIHNDFVTGSRELAALTGARIGASAAAGLQFEHQPLIEGEEVQVGDVTFRVLATPGHTPEHVSYLAQDRSAAGEPAVLFSGGSLLVGAVSRTDLLGHEHATGLARELYRSLHEKILKLPDDVQVYPTHGGGSFCTAAPGTERQTTIGQERRTNWLLGQDSPERFVEAVLGSMPSYPAYFHFMRALNQRGPRILGRIPELTPLPPAEVSARQRGGDALVDLRPVEQYARRHIPGSYHSELRPGFATWVGWVVPFGTPLILVSETTAAHDEAVRQLLRIGYEDLAGYLDGGVAAWEQVGLAVTRTPVLSMQDVRECRQRGDPLIVLDVRQDAEWLAGHLPHAQHSEVGSLSTAELPFPLDQPLATHCGHGQRAATALSVLERRGYRNLRLVTEGVDEWERAGLPLEYGLGV